jgi:hypothetical protein
MLMVVALERNERTASLLHWSVMKELLVVALDRNERTTTVQ